MTTEAKRPLPPDAVKPPPPSGPPQAIRQATDQLAIVRSLATEERYTVSPQEKVALRAVLARLDGAGAPATNYKRLQNLCDDIAAHLESAQLRERDGRGTYIEMQQAEQSAIELFRGIVRAGAERKNAKTMENKGGQPTERTQAC